MIANPMSLKRLISYLNLKYENLGHPPYPDKNPEQANKDSIIADKLELMGNYVFR